MKLEPLELTDRQIQVILESGNVTAVMPKMYPSFCGTFYFLAFRTRDLEDRCSEEPSVPVRDTMAVLAEELGLPSPSFQRDPYGLHKFVFKGESLP